MTGRSRKNILKINPWFRWMVIILSGYTIIRGAVLSIITFNPDGLIPIAMGGVLLLIIYRKSIHSQAALIGWALYFIVKYGVVFFGLILSHHHNNYSDIAMIELMEKFTFFLMGIVIWIGAYKYVEVHEVEEIDSSKT
jgi:hypothetical protein